MNYVDVILLLIMALAIWGGWKKGFILGSINLLVWVGSLLCGFFLYRYMANILQQLFPSLGVWTLPLSFLLVIILTRLLLALIFNNLLRRTPEDYHTTSA